MTGSEQDNKNLYCLNHTYHFYGLFGLTAILCSVSHPFKMKPWGLIKDNSSRVPITVISTKLNCSGKTFLQVVRNTAARHHEVPALCVPWSQKSWEEVHLS